MATDYDLARAVCETLAGAVPGISVDVAGDLRLDRKSITDFRVRVTPASWSAEPAARIRDRETRVLHVGIVGPAGDASITVIEAGLELCDTIRAVWGPGGALRLTKAAGHCWVPPLKQEPLWRPEWMYEEPRLFLAVIEATYQE